MKTARMCFALAFAIALGAMNATAMAGNVIIKNGEINATGSMYESGALLSSRYALLSEPLWAGNYSLVAFLSGQANWNVNSSAYWSGLSAPLASWTATNTTQEMRNAVNNSGYYNISINSSNVANPIWLAAEKDPLWTGNYSGVAFTANQGNWSVNSSAYWAGLSAPLASWTSTYNSTYDAKAGTGNCGAGQFVQNTTTGGVQCAVPSAGSETDPLWTGNSSTVARTGSCPLNQYGIASTASGITCAQPHWLNFTGYSLSTNWAGTLGGGNITSATIANAQMAGGVYTAITGIGAQAQNLNMNSYSIAGASWLNATNLNVSSNGYFGGSVGIGTMSPQNTLNVVGDANITGDFSYGCPNTATNQMVKVGSFCIDKYEAYTVSGSLGNANGNNTNAVAGSKAGVLPQASVTWFQAAQECANAGKRLCTNAEWQTAVAGTPDPGADGGTTGCNVASRGTPNTTGYFTACVSRWGAYDMVGNVWEWVADWGQAGGNATALTYPDGTAMSPWPADYGGDNTWNVNGRAHNGVAWTNGAPAAFFRGGGWSDGASAGSFALSLDGAPSFPGTNIGFRCCK